MRITSPCLAHGAVPKTRFPKRCDCVTFHGTSCFLPLGQPQRGPLIRAWEPGSLGKGLVCAILWSFHAWPYQGQNHRLPQHLWCEFRVHPWNTVIPVFVMMCHSELAKGEGSACLRSHVSTDSRHPTPLIFSLCPLNSCHSLKQTSQGSALSSLLSLWFLPHLHSYFSLLYSQRPTPPWSLDFFRSRRQLPSKGLPLLTSVSISRSRHFTLFFPSFLLLTSLQYTTILPLT